MTAPSYYRAYALKDPHGKLIGIVSMEPQDQLKPLIEVPGIGTFVPDDPSDFHSAYRQLAPYRVPAGHATLIDQ